MINVLGYKSFFTPKNNQEWFLYYLFSDPEFSSAKEQILHELRELMGNEGLGIMLLLMPEQSLINHLRQNYTEPTKIIVGVRHTKPELLLICTKIIIEIEMLAKKFGVSVYTVELGIKYNKLVPGFVFGHLPLVSVEDDKVVIRLNGTMKAKDIEFAYTIISERLKELPDYRARNRSKENPALMYAVHKQRLNGLTFSQINLLYEDKELHGFTGSNPIVGVENLARSYNRYMRACHISPHVK